MTRAIILAAGQGTRLRPLTDDRPKTLVELVGRTLLQHQLDVLRACAVNEVHVATGYCGHMIESLGLPTTLNPDFDSTNMVESLFCARSFLQPGEDLVIGYGDIVYEQDNLAAVLESRAEIALMIDLEWRQLWSLRQEDPLEDAETLVLDEQGNVKELGKKPEGYERIHGQYTGLIKIRGDKIDDLLGFYDRLDRDAYYDGIDFRNMYMTSFLQCLIDAGWETKGGNSSWGLAGSRYGGRFAKICRACHQR